MSAKLGNAKHEEYAQLIARGIAQGESYVRAGYKKNDGAASNLRKRLSVAARIAELKAERIQQVPALNGEGTTIAELGVTRMWIAAQFNHIYDRAMDAEKYADATKALQNLDKMRADEQDSAPDDDRVPAAGRIDINDLGNILDKFADILSIEKQEPAQLELQEPSWRAKMKAQKAAYAAKG